MGFVSMVMGNLLSGTAILSREMRSSSRRRRTYLLRSAYVLFQLLGWTMVWIPMTQFNASSPLLAVGMMSQMASAVSIGIAWSQFFLSQVLMVLLLAGTISEETGRGTLAVLLATPLNGLQIALGKLLSRFLQLFLFLGIGLPILAIMRVWGGISWSYLMASACVTLAAAWATASLALLMSTWTTRMSRAAGKTFIILVVYVIVTAILPARWLYGARAPAWLPEVLLTLNPVLAMSELTRALMSPGRDAGPWPGHCLVMFGLGSVFLLWAVWRIPRVGRRHLQGATRMPRVGRGKAGADSRVYSVWHPILVWRAVRHMRRGGRRWSARLERVLGTVVLLAAYYLFGVHYEGWKDPVFHATFMVIYTFVGLLRVAVHASRSVAEERERRTWPLLLTSDLTAMAYVWQTLLGVLLRTLPAWGLMTLHLLIFLPLGVIHPLAPVLLAPFLSTLFLVLALFGLCISLWCRRSSTAVALCVTTYLLLSVPMCCPGVGLFSSPLFSVGLLMGTTSGLHQAASGISALMEPFEHPLEILMSLWMLPIKTAIQGGLAVGLAFLAPCWVRRRVFLEGGK
jgi:ABC-type transport system involved in multi-copper enzyme maturation permease subunit